MVLRPCPRCARPVTDLATRCPSCEVDLAAAPGTAVHEADPVRHPLERAAEEETDQRRGRSTAAVEPTSRWMRVGQVVAVLFCIASGFAAEDWAASGDGGESAEALGGVFGAVLAWMLMSALFLAWSRKTRRYIPFLAVAFAFLTASGRAQMDREEVARELTRTRGIAAALADTAGRSVVEGSSSAPPESEHAKLVWIMNRTLAELPAYEQEVARRHDFDPRNPPAAWVTPRYTASATSHPEVEQYWRGYHPYLKNYRDGLPGWLKSRVEVHAREAGVRSGALGSLLKGMSQGGAGLAESEALAWADSTASAALAYHRFLVSADARVSYDAAGDMAMFDLKADLARANALQDRVAKAAERLNQAQQAANRRGMQKVDSLATYVK